jgi:hypothetical protein
MNSQITMDLENLRKQYSNLLLKYQGALAEYTTYLNDPSSNNQFVTIKGQAFNGTGSAGESNARTLQKCIASCSNSKTCTGATFVSNKCMIRTGDSPLVPSSPNSYAIIPKGKQLLLNMEDLNKQLLTVNKEITNKIKVSEPVYNTTNQETYLKNKELIDTYEKLLDERRTIAEKLNEYETLDNAENENQIIITRNYYTYILLTILAVGIIILFYIMSGSRTPSTTPNIQYGGELRTSAYYIVFGLILFVIILRWSINYLTL